MSCEYVSVLYSQHHAEDPLFCCLSVCRVKARLHAWQEMAFYLEEVTAASHELGHHSVEFQMDFLPTAESFKDEREVQE